MFRNERLSEFSEKTLVAIILIMFLFFHALAAEILQRAGVGDDRAPKQNMRFQLYD